MINIHHFTFNPFHENTYVLYDETRNCIIIDPGCYERAEEKEISEFIKSNNLNPVRLINTHCHIDHVFGNAFISEKYDLKLEAHELEMNNLKSIETQAMMFGVNFNPTPLPDTFLKENELIQFGSSELEIIFVPGHSPGHIALVNKSDKIVIGGDVLFQMSIGRSDLPGGNHDKLIESIKTKILPLGDDFKVYPGHGPSTTVGFEKNNNPFLT